MTATVSKTNWLIWILLAFLLVSAPVPALVLCALLFLSYKLTRSDRSFPAYLSVIGRRVAPMTAIIACVVALATVVVGFPDGFARHLGFPMTFVTYYSFPETQAEPLGLWQRLAINPLRFWANALLYYCAFRLVGWFWHRVRTA